MTDKVQKIREEVERLYNQSLADENRQADRGLERAANVSYGKSKACKELLSFIDSPQEEPVKIKKGCKYRCLSDMVNKDTGNISFIGDKIYLAPEDNALVSEENGWLCDTSENASNFELVEEPVSEDFNEAAWLYYDKNRLPIPPEWDLHKEFIDFFKAGAQWQKKQDEKDIADMLFVARLKGADDGKRIMKEQMMKNAITAECFGAQSGDALFSIRLPAKDYMVGSEIKVIIIKEE